MKILTLLNQSEKVFFMRIFLSVLILIFSLETLTKADDIRDFEIEGVSIGDSLLNFASENEIKKAKSNHQYPNDKYIMYDYDKLVTPKKYDWISVTTKKNDKKYIITNMAGEIDYKELEECLKLKNEIESFIESLFKKIDKQENEYTSKQDKTGKSTIYGTQYYFKPHPSNEAISVNCYHMDEESGIRKSLKLSVNPDDYAYFLINEAYK